MALKDLFRKTTHKESASETPSSNFVLGVLDVFNLQNTDDLVVTGRVKGTISKGDRVCLLNPGDDDGCVFLSTIVGIETAPGVAANQASDCQVGLRMERGKLYRIKKGTVIYSQQTSSDEIHNTYISALGDGYVIHKNLELSDKDFEELSITDCAEIWRLFSWFHSKVIHSDDNEAKKQLFAKIDVLAKALCQKILSANEIYCVYSKSTGEPFLFSKTVKQGDGYMCSPPNILLFTDAYKENFSKQFNNEKFEIRKIENGIKKDGIYNFLGSTFYLNGACGVNILSEQTSIAANLLVPPPDYSNVKPQDIPVSNPDLVRWMLLLGQLGKPDTEDANTIYKLYFRFMSKEMIKARFLIPMQKDSDFPEADKDGKVILNKGTTIKFPTLDGKYGRPAVRMYTDWKRLRMVYGNEWGGLIQPIEGMIEVFDCAINVTEYAVAGCYVGSEMFEDIKKL